MQRVPTVSKEFSAKHLQLDSLNQNHLLRARYPQNYMPPEGNCKTTWTERPSRPVVPFRHLGPTVSSSGCIVGLNRKLLLTTLSGTVYLMVISELVIRTEWAVHSFYHFKACYSFRDKRISPARSATCGSLSRKTEHTKEIASGSGMLPRKSKA